MRKIIVSVALATATLAAVPASAQWGYERDYRHNDYRQYRAAEQRLLNDLDQVEQRIYRASERGRLSPRESVSLRREANQLRHRIYQAGRNGLSPREFERLQERVFNLRERFREERRDGNRYRDRW